MSLLTLTVATPLSVAVTDGAVASLRAEDASGDFGILPGHADFLTVIEAGVLRWRGETGPWHYCALRGGVLSVSGGRDVRIACREAVRAEDLATLSDAVARQRAAMQDAARQARSASTKLHARAVRQLMRRLASGGDSLGLAPEAEG